MLLQSFWWVLIRQDTCYNFDTIRSVSEAQLVPISQVQAHLPRLAIRTTSRHLRLIADWTPHWEAKCEEENERSLLTACHDFNMQFEQNRSWHVKPLKSVAMRLKSRRGNWHYLDMRSLKRTTLKSNKWQVSNCLNEIQLYIINKQLVRGSKRLTSSKHQRASWICGSSRESDTIFSLLISPGTLLNYACRTTPSSDAFGTCFVIYGHQRTTSKKHVFQLPARLSHCGWLSIRQRAGPS